MRSLCYTMLLSLLLGCGNDPGSQCPQLKPCDVTQTACQAHALAIARCWRGDNSTVAVPVSLQDRSVFTQINLDDAAKAEADTEAAVLRRGFALFDFSPWNFVHRQAAEAQSQWIAAYYDPEEKKIVIISGRNPNPKDVDTLVHEYVHALQDASGDLGRIGNNSLDGFLAGRAMGEGEADLIGSLSLATGYGFSPESVDYEKAATTKIGRSDAYARDEPDLITYAYPLFAYSYGFRHVLSSWRAGGAQALKTAWINRPLSTRQFVAGPAAQAPAAGWSEDISALAVPKVSGDFRLVHVTSLGHWFSTTVLRRTVRDCIGSGPLPAIAADSFSVWHAASTGAVLSAWRIRFGQEPVGPNTVSETSYAILQALDQCTPHKVSAVGDREIVLLATSSVPTAPDGLVTGWGPVEMPPDATVTPSTAEKLGLVNRHTVHGQYGHAARE